MGVIVVVVVVVVLVVMVVLVIVVVVVHTSHMFGQSVCTRIASVSNALSLQSCLSRFAQ